MASLNKIQLIGFLGKDPEMRYMPNGDAITFFALHNQYVCGTIHAI